MKSTILRLIPLLLYVLIVTGCSENLIYTDPNSLNRKCAGQTITVLPVPVNMVTINNLKDVPDDFPNDLRPAENVVRDSLMIAIDRYCEAYMLEPDYRAFPNPDESVNYADATLFQPCNYRIGGDEIIITLFQPTEACLRQYGIDTDYVLVISNVKYDRVMHSTPMMMGAGGAMMGGGGSDNLESSCNFLVWDVKNQTPIRYGIAKSSAGVAFAMTKNTWFTNFGNLIKHMMEGKPFWFPVGN